MPQSSYPMHNARGFRFLDEGPRSASPPVVLLHGMLGDLSNWTATVRALIQHGHRVLVPVLPVYDLPLSKTSIQGLVQYTHDFIEAFQLDPAVLVGNSLGGQVALFYVLHYPSSVSALVLSGASGIYEHRLGTSLMRRDSRQFIRERAAVTFYDSAHVTDELVEEMYTLVNDRPRAIRLIKMARSSKKETVTERLSTIEVPTLLIWGCNDEITPPDVAEEFLKRIPDARLHLIDRCGHAPMMERPEAFNRFMLDFLQETTGISKLKPSPEAT